MTHSADSLPEPVSRGRYREPVSDSPLSVRETEVLIGVHAGQTVAQIASTLYLSGATVRNHLAAATGRLGAKTRDEAAELAHARGWLVLPD